MATTENCSVNTLSQTSDLNAKFGLGITLFAFSPCGFFLAFYYFRRRSSEYLQRRNFELIFLTTTFSGFLYVQPLREYIGRNEFSCLLLDLAPELTAFMVLFHLARVYQYMLSFAFNVQLAKLHYKREAANSPLFLALKESNEEPAQSDEQNNDVYQNVAKSYNGTRDYAATRDSELRILQRLLRINSFVYSIGSKLRLLVFLSLIVALSIALSINWDVAHCTGCEQSFQHHIFVAIFMLLLATISLYLMRFTHIHKDPDIMGLHSELYFSSMVMLVSSIIFISLTALDPKNLYADGFISWNYIICAGAQISFIIVVPFQIYKSFLVKNISDRAKLNQKEILRSKIGINYFKMHLFAVQDFENIRNILFWQNAVAWRKAYSTTSLIIREENFFRIYETFIQRKGIMHMTMSADTYEQIIDDSDRTKNIPANVFEVIIKQTEEALNGTYERFIESEHYNLLLRGLQGNLNNLEDYAEELAVAT